MAGATLDKSPSILPSWGSSLNSHALASSLQEWPSFLACDCQHSWSQMPFSALGILD